MMSILNCKKGMTIIELLIVLFAVILLINVMFFVMIENYQLFDNENREFNITHDTQNVMDLIVAKSRIAETLTIESAGTTLLLQGDVVPTGNGTYTHRFIYDGASNLRMERQEGANALITTQLLTNVTSFMITESQNVYTVTLTVESVDGREFQLSTKVYNRSFAE